MSFSGNILLGLLIKAASTRRGKWKLVQLLQTMAKEQNENKEFFNQLLQLAHAGMNVGIGTYVGESGEKFAMEYVKRKLESNKEITIFDVGANVGQYATELLQTYATGNVVIHSFEPGKKTYDELQEKLKDKKVYLHNIGFGSIPEKKTLYFNSNVTTLGSVVKTDFKHWNYVADKEEIITIDTIDSFCATNDIQQIDFLKIDVEGYEYEVLLGAKRMLDEGRIKYIQFEFGQNHVFSRIFFRDFFYLLSPSYNLSRILRDGLYQIDGYWETNENFLTTNFLAELKRP